MPDLDKNIHFGGADDVSGEDLGRAEVPNFTSGADAALHSNFDWSGKAIGFIGLTLNPENDRVASGVFVTRGETELEEFNSTCDQIWPQGPPNISFGIRVADLNQFTFNGGGLWSDLSSTTKYDQIIYLVLINLVTPKAQAKHEAFIQQTGLCISA